MTARVLVTGGAGYIGSHMVKALRAEGHTVTVFDDLSTGHADAVNGVEFIRGDLKVVADLESLFDHRGYDVVMHFAACCYVGESVLEPLKYYANNVGGTVNLLDAMRRKGMRNLVFSSSCATYGNPIRLPIDEKHPQRPVNPYGMTKFMAERVIADCTNAFGLRAIALRYFNAAGSDPGGELGERHYPETHLIPRALMEAKRLLAGDVPTASGLEVYGVDFATADGTCVRDYVHVSDLCGAHMLALRRLLDGEESQFEAFNLGNERGFSVMEVIAACSEVCGVPIGYTIKGRRVGDPPALIADSTRAREVLGWSPRYVELPEIVRTAWQWFCKNDAE